MIEHLLPALDDSALAGALRQLPISELEAAFRSVVPSRQSGDQSLVVAVQSRFADLSAGSREQLLALNSPWRASLLGRWCLAESWLADRTRIAPAIGLWTELIEQSGIHAAHAFFGRARARREAGDNAGAMADLVACAQRTADAGLLNKAARLMDRLLAKGTPAPGKQVRVALVSSSTTDLLPPLLRLACARDGMAAEVYTGPFGAYRQELLDAGSALHRFKPDFVIIALHWRDAALSSLGNASDAAEKFVDGLRELWTATQRITPCTVLQHSFDQPACEAAGYLATYEEGGRSRQIAEINRRLFETRASGVVIVDCGLLQARSGFSAWSDEALWHVAKQHPSATALPRLVDRYARLMAARIGLTKKVLVLDLDNTLWGGVVGEDGPHGIKVGPPSAVGEAHAALQRYALELKARGVLLAVCSKNNEADAREPFRSTLGMELKEDDFVAFVANWEEKPDNLRRIAKMLNLGTDSLVFLDDNPLERAKVRRSMPEVAVVDLPADPAGYVAALDGGAYFEALSLSSEDTARHASYVANLQRDSLKAKTGNLDEFLTSLDMRMCHGPFNDAVHDRVVQLLNKTNQFNLTTRRYGSGELTALRSDAGVWTQYFKLVDCFGDNGVIGLLMAKPGEAADVWEVDSFLMSCRVLGRQAEEFMIRTLLTAAKERGIRLVRGVFVPTAKNAMVADLYERLGFALEKREAGGAASFIWNVADQTPPHVPYVRGVCEA